MRVYSCIKCTIDYTSSKTSVRSALSSSDAQVATWGCEPRRALNTFGRASRLLRSAGCPSLVLYIPSRGVIIVRVNSSLAARCSRTLSHTLRCLLLSPTTCSEPAIWSLDRRGYWMGLRTTTDHPVLLHVVLCEPVTIVGAAASLWQVRRGTCAGASA